MNDSNTPTEPVIRDIRSLLQKPSWSETTNEHVTREVLRETMELRRRQDEQKKSSRNTNWAMIGVIIALVTAAYPFAKFIVIAALSTEFATKTEMRAGFDAVMAEIRKQGGEHE